MYGVLVREGVHVTEHLRGASDVDGVLTPGICWDVVRRGAVYGPHKFRRGIVVANRNPQVVACLHKPRSLGSVTPDHLAVAAGAAYNRDVAGVDVEGGGARACCVPSEPDLLGITHWIAGGAEVVACVDIARRELDISFDWLSSVANIVHRGAWNSCASHLDAQIARRIRARVRAAREKVGLAIDDRERNRGVAGIVAGVVVVLGLIVTRTEDALAPVVEVIGDGVRERGRQQGGGSTRAIRGPDPKNV